MFENASKMAAAMIVGLLSMGLGQWEEGALMGLARESQRHCCVA